MLINLIIWWVTTPLIPARNSPCQEYVSINNRLFFHIGKISPHRIFPTSQCPVSHFFSYLAEMQYIKPELRVPRQLWKAKKDKPFVSSHALWLCPKQRHGLQLYCAALWKVAARGPCPPEDLSFWSIYSLCLRGEKSTYYLKPCWIDCFHFTMATLAAFVFSPLTLRPRKYL